MKRAISKIFTSMFLTLALAFLIPFANANAMTSSSGDGTEANPYKLTIGYCENDAFTYNANSGFCYLSVTFTKTAEVSCSFAQNGPWVMIKRDGTTYKSLSGDTDTFLAKQGETVNILIKSGSDSVPIRFTSSALSDIALYCPNSALGKHDFSASYSSECTYKCGYSCAHPKDSREYYDEYDWLPNRQHAQRFKCLVCEVITSDKSDPAACTIASWVPDNNFPRHDGECTLCGNGYTDACTFTVKKYRNNNWEKHYLMDTCSVCGKTGSSQLQNHTFNNNKCTKCGFTRVIPGKLQVTSAKQSSKLKVKNIYHEARWVKNSYGQWIYQKAYTSKEYNYKITFKFKKAKDVQYYIISTHSYIDAPYICTVSKNKTSATCTYKDYKKKSKVTLYMIPISKTGTPGTPVKKVVKLKN